MNVWEGVAEILRREGTELLFNFPANPLIDACAARGIAPMVCRQERVGCGMADGYSRVTSGDRIGVFAMQAGPGAENAFPGVASAYADSSPVLLLPMGQDQAHAQVSPYFTSSNVYGPVTKSLEVLQTPQQTVDVMRRAFGELRSGRPGPCMVEIPRDVGAMEATLGLINEYRPVVGTRSAGDPDAIELAAAAIVAASRPLIFAGQGVLYAKAWDELRELAELLAAPVATSIEGIGAFPEDHRLSIGLASVTSRGSVPHFVARADLVLAVGASLTRGDLAPDIAPGPTIVHLTNHPSDLNKCYFDDHPILGDAQLVLRQLVVACRERLPDGGRSFREVAAEIESVEAAWMTEWMPRLTSSERPITPYRVIWDFIRTFDPSDMIVTHDSGSPRHQLTPFYRTTRPHGYIGWGKSHALGTGIGLIMGAKAAYPDTFCVHFMGDAAFGMTGLDTETAVRCGLPVLIIVLNNSHMANESQAIVIAHERYAARDLSGDYCEVALGLGLAAERIDDPDSIIPALRRARAAVDDGRPALLEFITSTETSASNYLALTSAKYSK